jgi:hypothetical protein
VNPLEPPDRHYLLAAQGWIELSNAQLTQIAQADRRAARHAMRQGSNEISNPLVRLAATS